MKKREQDQTKRITSTSLLATAQRWLETAAALLYDNQQAADRCTVTASEIAQVLQCGIKPDLPENFDQVFGLFDQACKAHAAGQSVPVLPGLHYVAAFDFFLTGESESQGGQMGDRLEERLKDAVEVCASLDVTASRLDKAYRAVCNARFTMVYERELAIQEVK